MVRFLEREGYDITYATNIDTHEDEKLLLSHRAFLSIDHDEYWSYDARAHVEAARDMGINLGFFGANAVYWQVRYEPSLLTGAPDRTLVAYKSNAPSEDPYYADPATRPYATMRFRDLDRPEDALIGVMYNAIWPVNTDVVITNPSSWVVRGTGLYHGAHLTGLAGYEVDSMFFNAPPGTVIIAHSPVLGRQGPGFTDMTVYTWKSGATVFATGTQQWSWGLDDFYDRDLSGPARGQLAGAQARALTRNVLERFIAPLPGGEP
jgi:hypothetical protein